MTRKLLVWLFPLLLLGLAGRATAQPANVRAEIDAIKKELEELRKVAATAPTLAQAVQELSAKVAMIEQELDKRQRQVAGVPEAIQSLDELGLEVKALGRDLEYLRTEVANISQPAVATGGGVSYDEGFRWTTSDGLYSARLFGYMQVRYDLQTTSDFDSVNVSSFAIPRARLGLEGHIGKDTYRYRFLVEQSQRGPIAQDVFMDVEFRPELVLRAGLDRVPFNRSAQIRFENMTFPEANGAEASLAYQRDVGVWIHGAVFDDLLRYKGGVSNGAGWSDNDNIDLAYALRLESVLLGEYLGLGEGDIQISAEPQLMVGAAFVHDLVRVPETVAGIEVGARDVDADGVLDNVRVLSSSVDATFRLRGLELFAEAIWRHERWGTILEHMDNADLAAEVLPSAKGRRNYLAFTGHVTYFAIPKKLLVGGRLGHVRLPFLGVGGATPVLPLADRLLDFDLLVQLYREGSRLLGLQYTVRNFNERTGPDPEDDVDHRFLLEAQLKI